MLQKASQEMTMFFVREEGITISYTFSFYKSMVSFRENGVHNVCQDFWKYSVLQNVGENVRI